MKTPTSKAKGAGLALSLTAAMVASFEGVRNYAYSDPIGIPTACFGRTEGVKLGQYYSDAECEEYLFEEIIKYQRAVRKLVTVPMNQNQLAAFTSFTYNAGIKAFETSTLRRKLNNGDYTGACNELLKWDKATLAGKKITLPGLTKRRGVERAVCLQS